MAKMLSFMLPFFALVNKVVTQPLNSPFPFFPSFEMTSSTFASDNSSIIKGEGDLEAVVYFSNFEQPSGKFFRILFSPKQNIIPPSDMPVRIRIMVSKNFFVQNCDEQTDLMFFIVPPNFPSALMDGANAVICYTHQVDIRGGNGMGITTDGSPYEFLIPIFFLNNNKNVFENKNSNTDNFFYFDVYNGKRHIYHAEIPMDTNIPANTQDNLHA